MLNIKHFHEKKIFAQKLILNSLGTFSDSMCGSAEHPYSAPLFERELLRKIMWEQKLTQKSYRVCRISHFKGREFDIKIH